jgi:hypothetical protein
MTDVLRQMRGLDLHDLLLIIAIALSIPLRLALPLAAQLVSSRIDIRLRVHDQTNNTRAILIPS